MSIVFLIAVRMTANLSLYRNWTFRRIWFSSLSRRSCLAHHRLWFDWCHVVLHRPGARRTCRCIPCCWLLRCLCKSIHRPCLGICYGLEVRFTLFSIPIAWTLLRQFSYALSWLITLPLEIVAASITMSFWQGAKDVNPAAWVTLFLFVIISINMFGVKGYGEAEFVFCKCSTEWRD